MARYWSSVTIRKAISDDFEIRRSNDDNVMVIVGEGAITIHTDTGSLQALFKALQDYNPPTNPFKTAPDHYYMETD